MEDVERSPCALTHTIKAEGSRAFIYLSDCFIFLPPSQSPPHPSFSPCDSGHGATASPPPFPEPLPLPLSHLWCGSSHFLVATSAALALTRDTHDKLGVEVKVMGCESNAAATTTPPHLPASPLYTLWTRAPRQLDTKTHRCRPPVCVSVCKQYRSQYSQSLTLLTRQDKDRGCTANRVTTWM